jgi:hypothetical protein
MFKKSFCILALSIACFGFTIGCDMSDTNGTASIPGAKIPQIQSAQPVVASISDDVLEEIIEAIQEYQKDVIIDGSTENGSMSWHVVVKKKFSMKENFEVTGCITYTNFQPEEESMILNGTVPVTLGFYFDPLICGLLHLGMPYITRLAVDGTITTSGSINGEIDAVISANTMVKPQIYSGSINMVDISADIEKAIKAFNWQK